MKILAGALLLVGLMTSGADAAKPVYLNPLWQDSGTKREDFGQASCRYVAPPIRDLREDPELIGVLDGRKLLAPRNREAWLTSILSGLSMRGIDLKVADTQDDAGDGRLAATISFKSASVDYYKGGFTSVVSFDITQSNGKSVDSRTIRTRGVTTDFLGDVRRRADASFQKAVEKALGEMAAAMREFCGQAQAVAGTH